MSWAQTTVHIVSTRNHFDKPGNLLITDRAYEPFEFENIGCPQEAVIYVHGVWTGSGIGNDSSWTKQILDNAIEIFGRAKLSLDSLSYVSPLIGFSWDSDTQISGDGWRTAQRIAERNGDKLAQFIIDFKDWCHQQERDVKIRLIGHSLGAQVILSSLENLSENTGWNDRVTSVNLIGAAVDDDAVSKGVYGNTIEDEVSNFYNLYDPEDDALESGDIYWSWSGWRYFYGIYNSLENQPVYYPFFEQDLALGQNGIESALQEIDKPRNYADINVEQEIPNFTNANGDDQQCDLINPINGGCTINDVGDNHLSYAGVRNNIDNDILEDNGAMDILVSTWGSNS